MSEEEKKDPPAEGEENKEENKDEEKKSLVAMPKIGMPKMKMSFDDPPPPESDATDPDQWNLKSCCCCLCACSHDRVGDASCFGCCPIKCGVIFVAIFIFLLSVIMLACTFFQLLNEYLPWWYTFVSLIVQAPQVTGASMCIYFFAKDKRSTRSKLPASVILSLISVALWCIWQLVFFLAIYKRDTVYMGMGPANDESNYRSSSKKQYLFTVLAETVILVVVLSYWLMVVSQYKELMNKKYDDEEAAEDERKDKEKADKKAKEDEEKEQAKADKEKAKADKDKKD